MNFSDYQKESRKTAVYPVVGQSYVYPVLGLLGEAGEIAEKVKKIFRDEGQKLTEAKRELLKKELGDVLWYLAQLSTELGLDLDEVAEFNLAKLKSRQTRGVIQGNGDNR